MNKYNIKMTISFQGEIQAETEADAEQMAWGIWGAESDAEISYDCVEKIVVDDLGTMCELCEEGADNCECEEEEEEDSEEEAE